MVKSKKIIVKVKDWYNKRKEWLASEKALDFAEQEYLCKSNSSYFKLTEEEMEILLNNLTELRSNTKILRDSMKMFYITSVKTYYQGDIKKITVDQMKDIMKKFIEANLEGFQFPKNYLARVEDLSETFVEDFMKLSKSKPKRRKNYYFTIN